MAGFKIRKSVENDRDWVLECVRGWGADYVITRGRMVFPQELPAFIAEADDGERVGLITYEFRNDECEIITLDALRKFEGIGTALIKAVETICRLRTVEKADQSLRLWLLTTNDNLDAIRFYQRKGFTIAAVHVNALERSRQMKPSIPEIGQHGIPLRDEIEFERWIEADA